MITWIDKSLVLAIHDRQLLDHGGIGGLLDERALDAALELPRQLHAFRRPAPDLAELAARLAAGLLSAHAFVDGNKRTAYLACLSFLALNDAEVEAGSHDKVESFLALAEGTADAAEFADWLRRHIPRMSGRRIHEPNPGYPPSPRPAP